MGHSRQRPLLGLVAVVLIAGLGAAVAGCLAAFAPALRTTGVHADAAATDRDADCMTCHEAESAALARMQAAPPGTPAPTMMGPDEPGLVPDWMIGVEGGCLACHGLRPARGRSPRTRTDAADPARSHGHPPAPGAHDGSDTAGHEHHPERE